MHVHAVTRVHAVTPKLVICVMYLTSILTDSFDSSKQVFVWSNDTLYSVAYLHICYVFCV